MASLSPTMVLRHGAVGAVIVTSAAAGLFGLVGEDLDERFDQKQITVTPAGGDAVRVREIVDQDFGNARDRHGYQRVIPTDFGAPTDVVASSPDAPDDVSVRGAYDEVTIRVGDPDQTVSGQHRYELAYTYPQARLSTGRLGLDIVGTDDDETGRLEIVVTGFELTNLECNVGRLDDDGGCEFEQDGDVYRAVIEPLAAGNGVTIGADVSGVTEPADVPAPELPERRAGSNRLPLAAVMAGAGTLAGGAVYRAARRRGRNQVAGTGAADAAFGTGPGDVTRRAGQPLPPPPAPGAPESAAAPGMADGSVRLVADEDMADLATTEFVPPSGIEPWQGAVALRERIDNNTVGAWFSGLAAREVLTLERDGSQVTLRPGPAYDRAAEQDRAPLAQLFTSAAPIRLGTYSKSFAAAWRDVQTMQGDWIKRSGWWTRLAPSGTQLGAAAIPLMVVALASVIVFSTALGSVVGLFENPVVAVGGGIVAVALVAFGAYGSLLPARSVTGSAVALRTESFRRFLAASEGRHVEWAWEHGLLREYSAWAVALGTADAWQHALDASTVPRDQFDSGPLLVYSMASTFSRAHTAPSSSGGGGGGGGFSGGSVGGGGGGGSSGSW